MGNRLERAFEGIAILGRGRLLKVNRPARSANGLFPKGLARRRMVLHGGAA